MRITPKQRSKLRDEQCPDPGWNSKKPIIIQESEMQDERSNRKLIRLPERHTAGR